MGVPYVIVKGKARLGTVVHKKTAAVLALQDVKSEDQRELATLVSAAKANLCVLGLLKSQLIYSDVEISLALTSTKNTADNGVEVSVAPSRRRSSRPVLRLPVKLSLLLTSPSYKTTKQAEEASCCRILSTVHHVLGLCLLCLYVRVAFLGHSVDESLELRATVSLNEFKPVVLYRCFTHSLHTAKKNFDSDLNLLDGNGDRSSNNRFSSFQYATLSMQTQGGANR
jgi:hypothetical protein